MFKKEKLFFSNRYESEGTLRINEIFSDPIPCIKNSIFHIAVKVLGIVALMIILMVDMITYADFTTGTMANDTPQKVGFWLILGQNIAGSLLLLYFIFSGYAALHKDESTKWMWAWKLYSVTLPVFNTVFIIFTRTLMYSQTKRDTEWALMIFGYILFLLDYFLCNQVIFLEHIVWSLLWLSLYLFIVIPLVTCTQYQVYTLLPWDTNVNEAFWNSCKVLGLNSLCYLVFYQVTVWKQKCTNVEPFVKVISMI